jgi:hypothetical protein
LIENQVEGEKSHFKLYKNGLLMYKNMMYIHEVEDIKLLILNELHKNPYSRYPHYQEIITMLRKKKYWPNVKGEIVEYLAKCI